MRLLLPGCLVLALLAMSGATALATTTATYTGTVTTTPSLPAALALENSISAHVDFGQSFATADPCFSLSFSGDLLDPGEAIHVYPSGNPLDGGFGWTNLSASPLSSVGPTCSSTYGADYSDGNDFLISDDTAGEGTYTVSSISVSATVTGFAPQNQTAPTISGTATARQVLTGSNGTWTGTTSITYEHWWLRCPDATCAGNYTIVGTDTTYTVNRKDLGYYLDYYVRATNFVGFSDANSVATLVRKACSGKHC